MIAKILQVTTYPIDHPDHGGKLRSFYIRKSLREKFRVETLSFSLSQGDSIAGLSVNLDHDGCMQVIKNGYLADWGINDYLGSRPELRARVVSAVKEFSPDIVLIEQPFMWPLIEEMLRDRAIGDALVVYSSHNNEYALKKDVYEGIFRGADLESNLARVAEIERGIARRADLSLAVTEGDVEYLKSMAPATDVLLYRNGHQGINDAPAKSRWLQKFKDYERNWVFVGSWHPPNIDGLHALIGGGINDLPSGRLKVWVFGNAGPGLMATYGLKESDLPNFSIQGLAETDEINSAIAAAAGVVLPVWGGGGSNLKTAQALLSGKTVVGSKYSFRGFENYMREHGVFLFDSPAELVAGMDSVRVEESYVRPSVEQELKWENLLGDLPEKIEEYFLKKSVAG
ncbi:glycosyltransferase [Burkholderia diffusa]|uniref:Glycosyltransferase n=1 Tax=Burkholderia diffusa TaxID=488732 RepID=A0A6P2LV69_9BURK|nr:glycosyltransferase [Burkholderia diffusa]KAB0659447.1 hypothetical protein F7R23_09580 [Burkholderia diffusa]MBM2651585.1 glycosyltransferase [Burkholderia diffusa]VWB71073.1 glycosyltransferase [Burkholderia diffusa]